MKNAKLIKNPIKKSYIKSQKQVIYFFLIFSIYFHICNFLMQQEQEQVLVQQLEKLQEHFLFPRLLCLKLPIFSLQLKNHFLIFLLVHGRFQFQICYLKSIFINFRYFHFSLCQLELQRLNFSGQKLNLLWHFSGFYHQPFKVQKSWIRLILIYFIVQVFQF